MPSKKPTTTKAKPKKSAPRVQRVPMTGRLRTLGTEQRPARAKAPARTTEQDALARKAVQTLREEFERVFALKEKLSAESKIGSTEKGRDARRSEEKVRGLISSLEGMSRFALAMGLITPAESRELYADAMKRGLFAGWR